MCWLEVRSEQLVIGAVLAGRTVRPSAVLLQTDDFAYPVAGGLYTDILHVQARESDPKKVTETLGDLYSKPAGIDADTLVRYAQQAASADDALITLAYQRVLLDGSERAIQDTTAALRRRPAQGDDEQQTRAAHYERLGLALHRRNRILQAVLPEDIKAHNEFISANPDQAKFDRPKMPRRERIANEEHILAGLVQHPATLFTVTGWFSEWIFTSVERRNIYRTLTEHLLPSTTSTHQIYLQRALKKLHMFDCPHDMQRARELALADRLHRSPVTPADAVSVARNLLAETAKR